MSENSNRNNNIFLIGSKYYWSQQTNPNTNIREYKQIPYE